MPGDTYTPTEYLLFYTSENTRKAVKYSLKKYLEVILDRTIKHSELDQAWADYLASGRDLSRDLMMFPAMFRKLNLAPITLQLCLSIVEQYLSEAHDVELTKKQKQIRKRSEPAYRHITEKIPLTRKEIKTLLSHSDERLTAEILMATSGGLRIGEILHLEARDVDLDELPATIRVRAEISKNQIPRKTRISQEAVDAIRAYLRVRDRLCVSGTSPDEAIEKQENKRLIPYSHNTERRRLIQAARDAGLTRQDPITKRYVIHFHAFRAYFSTHAKMAGVPEEYVEHLMGHSGYLAGAYWLATPEEEARLYSRIEPFVTISGPEDYADLKIQQKTELEELRAANIRQQEVLAILAAQLADLQRDKMPVISQITAPSSPHQDIDEIR